MNGEKVVKLIVTIPCMQYSTKRAKSTHLEELTAHSLPDLVYCMLNIYTRGWEL